MILLIDGDILVYSVGFSCETRWYEVECPNTGETKTFQTKKDMKLYNKDIDTDSARLCQSAEPDYVAKYLMKNQIERWKSKFKTDGVKVYLTDVDLKNNFRYKITDQYKANRKGGAKPLHYQMLRDYLMASYDTIIVTGIEADDALGIAQTEDSVIISKDKDLLQVPGLHYNIMKNKIVRASKKGELELWRDKAGKARLTGHGFKWFCAQMLLGDAVDNIKGIHRVGDVKAYSLLGSQIIHSYICEDTGEKTNVWKDLNLSNKECWAVVKSTYKKADRMDDLLLNAQLLWILREEGDWFNEEKI